MLFGYVSANFASTKQQTVFCLKDKILKYEKSKIYIDGDISGVGTHWMFKRK